MTTLKLYILGYDIVAMKDKIGVLVNAPAWTHYSPVEGMPRATNGFWQDRYGYAILKEAEKALEGK